MCVYLYLCVSVFVFTCICFEARGKSLQRIMLGCTHPSQKNSHKKEIKDYVISFTAMQCILYSVSLLIIPPIVIQRHQILGRVVSAITSALFWQSLLLFARIRILHNPSVKDFMKKLIWVNFYFPVFPCFFQKKNEAIYFHVGSMRPSTAGPNILL